MIKKHTHLERLNSIQPSYLPKYTEMGFEKIKLTDEMFNRIKNTWNDKFKWPLNNDFKEIEIDAIQNNNKNIVKSHLIVDDELNFYLHDNLKSILGEWSGEELEPTYVYGTRVYTDGSMLESHVDRYQTHIISAIINVDQKVNEPWPLQIYDDYGILHEVFLEPGEMLMYESSRLVHGREKPLNGDYFANIFVHYKPVFWDEFELPMWEQDMLKELNQQKVEKSIMKSNEILIEKVDKKLTSNDCDKIIRMAKKDLKDLTVVSGGVEDNLDLKSRTGEGCWLYDGKNKFIKKLKTITKELTGLPIENQEAPNVIHYEKGGFYDNHMDWFHDISTIDSKNAGQRLYTVMFYLNDEYTGGETNFPTLNKKIKGGKGQVVIWKNTDDNGNGLEEVLHAGLPVKSGEKWICTIWVRENKFR